MCVEPRIIVNVTLRACKSPQEFSSVLLFLRNVAQISWPKMMTALGHSGIWYHWENFLNFAGRGSSTTPNAQWSDVEDFSL